MPYASPVDIYKRFQAASTHNLTLQEWESNIAYADACIDSALAHRYSVPFASDPESTPPIIRQISIDLATEDLVNRFPQSPDWLVARANRARDKLAALADGTMLVVGVDGSVVAGLTETRGIIRTSTSGYVPTFGVAPSLSERIDPNRVEDEDDART